MSLIVCRVNRENSVKSIKATNRKCNQLYKQPFFVHYRVDLLRRYFSEFGGGSL